MRRDRVAYGTHETRDLHRFGDDDDFVPLYRERDGMSNSSISSMSDMEKSDVDDDDDDETAVKSGEDEEGSGMHSAGSDDDSDNADVYAGQAWRASSRRNDVFDNSREVLQDHDQMRFNPSVHNRMMLQNAAADRAHIRFEQKLREKRGDQRKRQRRRLRKKLEPSAKGGHGSGSNSSSSSSSDSDFETQSGKSDVWSRYARH